MKFGVWFNQHFDWWDTLEDAQREATQLLAQNLNTTVAIPIYCNGESFGLHSVVRVNSGQIAGEAS